MYITPRSRGRGRGGLPLILPGEASGPGAWAPGPGDHWRIICRPFASAPPQTILPGKGVGEIPGGPSRSDRRTRRRSLRPCSLTLAKLPLKWDERANFLGTPRASTSRRGALQCAGSACCTQGCTLVAQTRTSSRLLAPICQQIRSGGSRGLSPLPEVLGVKLDGQTDRVKWREEMGV